MFWLLGGFWRITWGDVVLLATVALSSWGVLFRLAPELDLLLLGDRSAELSGVRMRRLKPLLMLTVATLSATVVSCCGVIGFVGLAVPHMVRMLCGGTFIALRAKDRQGMLLAAGATAIVCAQGAANMAVVTHLLPTKGLALPFLSYGGSCLLSSFCAVGVLLGVGRATLEAESAPEAPGGRLVSLE